MSADTSALPAAPVPAPGRQLAPAALADYARTLGALPELWEPAVLFTRPERFWLRLDRGAHHEVWLLSWLPGQGTEIHSHGGSSGAFTVVRGELTEGTFAAGEPVADAVVRRLPTGGVRGFGPRHIHQVSNEGSEPAVSVHVYSPALPEMTYYAPDAAGRLAFSRTEASA